LIVCWQDPIGRVLLVERNFFLDSSEWTIFHHLRQATLLDTSGFVVNTADRYLAISSFTFYCTFHSHLVITDLAYCVDLDCSA
jgi:hypothetical protein